MNQPQDEAYRYVPLFESWQVDEKIGEGSYGVVYKVSKREMGETYDSAMKVITVPTKEQYREVESSFGGDQRAMTEYFEDIVKNIVREIKMLYSLGGNANIIGYQDHKVVKKQDGLGWEILIRMEYVTSLRKYQKEHSMTREDVMRLGIDICSALETCSKKGIVHRDIKDDNIFVSDDGVFKLGDFGIARELSKSGRAASMRGTPLYMAPEIYRGDKYDAAVDIYSLGIVLYKMLNYGRMPLTPPYPEKMRYQDSEDALELRMSGASLPNPANAEGVLADIVLRACAYSVQDRYASPAAMKADMLRALASMSEAQKQQVVLFATEKGEADLGTRTSTSEEKSINDEPMAGGTIGIPVDQATDGASGDKPTKHDSTIGFPPSIDITSTAETPLAAPKEKSNPNVLMFEGEENNAKKSKASKRKWVISSVAAAILIIVCVWLYGRVIHIDLSASSLDMIVGSSQVIQAKVTRFLKGSQIENVDWSYNEDVLSIGNDGNVIAIGEGETTVEANIGVVKAYCIVRSQYPTINIGTTCFKTNVTELNLSGQGITDITQLSECFCLASLDISNNPITNIEPLENINTLENLNLSGTNVIDLRPLTSLHSLVWIDITNTQVTDISQLSNDTYVNMSIDPLNYYPDFGSVYQVNDFTSSMNFGGRAITWMSSDTSVGWYENGYVYITNTQSNLSKSTLSTVITGAVQNSSALLKYNIFISCKSYSFDWGEQISVNHCHGSPLIITPQIDDCSGFTLTFSSTAHAGNPFAKNWYILIKKDDNSWSVVKTVKIQDGIAQTATIAFDKPTSFSMIQILPNGYDLDQKCSWNTDITVTSISYFVN